jgi:hypothetical protein
VVDGHRRAVLAQFTPPSAEPEDQLFAGHGHQDRPGLGQHSPFVVLERDPAETRHQVLLAPTADPCLEACGAGDRTSGPVLRSGTPRLVIQEFWAWMTATQLVRASAAASLTTEAAAARGLRRREGSGPVTTDQVSFTVARHHAVCSMVQSRVTAGTSLAALAALAEDTSRVTLHTLAVTGRQRHSPRAQKARSGAAAATRTPAAVPACPHGSY